MPDVLPSQPFLTRAQIRQRQLAQLRKLLQISATDNPFYRSRLVLPNQELESLEQFNASFTLKSDLVEDQKSNPPFGTNLSEPLEHYTRCHQTSGTSGAPLRWLDTDESWSGLVESWMTVFRAAGVGAGDRVFFAFSFGPFLGFWLAFEAASKTRLPLPARWGA